MSIRAADAEGTHAGYLPSVFRWPGHFLRRHQQRKARSRGREDWDGCRCRCGWNLAVLECQRRLDYTGNPRGGLQVTDIGFHRSDHERPLRRTLFAENGTQGSDLDRVSQRSTGAVSLYILNLEWFYLCGCQRLADERLLCLPVGDREAAAMAVLIDRRTSDQRR